MKCEDKLAMVREALEKLTEAVGESPIKHLSPAIVAAYQKASSALDGLAFVERMDKREVKP